MASDPTDRRLRQLMGEMVELAPTPPPPERFPTEITPTRTGDGRKRSAAWVAAAAVAVVVAGLAGILATRGADDPLSVASQGSTDESTRDAVASAGAAAVVDRNGQVLYRFGETSPDLEPWVVDQVASELLSDEMIALGEEENERARALAEDGLTVRVALDAGLSALDVAGFEELDRRLDAAAVTVDNRTGEILSATSRSGGSLGMAKPAGSARIAIYAAALESGIGVDELIDGTGPCEVDFGDGVLSLDNYGGSDGGVAPLVDQAARASRCAEARLEAGLDGAAIEALRSMTGADVAGRVIDNPALTAVEHAAAMVAIANEGVLPDIGFVSEVLTADGRSIFRRGSSARVLKRPAATGLMTILHEIVKRGTGTRAQVDGLEVAGLTGTDVDFRAAWFVGTADGVTTAVWVALPDGEPMFNIGGRNVTGGSYPAELWARIMAGIVGEEPTEDGFTEDGLTEDGFTEDGCPESFPVGSDTTGDGVIDTCYAYEPSVVDAPTDLECPADRPTEMDTDADGRADRCVSRAGDSDSAPCAAGASSCEGPFAPRQGQIAVWTGSDLLVYGGASGTIDGADVDTGFRYDPAERTVTPLPPSPLTVASWPSLPAFWTGDSLLVGGLSRDEDEWGLVAQAFSIERAEWSVWPAPAEADIRLGGAVWTGEQLVITGGSQNDPDDRAWSFTPSTGEWEQLPDPGIDPTEGMAGVWTGTEAIFVGGNTAFGRRQGVAYAPGTGTWRRLPPTTITQSLQGHQVFWTGQVVLVVSGHAGPGHPATVSIYDPAANDWSVSAPMPISPRERAAAAWTGTELIVWGGYATYGQPDDDGDAVYRDGAAYDPATDTWRVLAASPLSDRCDHSGTWTGEEFIVVGGSQRCGDPNVLALGDGAAYDPATDTWTLLDPAPDSD